MHITNRKESSLLLVGDIIILTASLWLMLLVRHFQMPEADIFMRHLEPFSILFAVWVLVFFIAGLYEKHTLLLKSKLPSVVLNAQLVNTALAVLFFYTIPYFAITPKTNLFIYLVISFVLVLVWRNIGPRLFSAVGRENALLIASGKEMRELKDEVNENERYSVRFVSTIDIEEIQDEDFQNEIVNRVYAEDVSLVVIDIHDEQIKPILPHLYNLIFSGIHFLDMHKVYEEVFNRVPISLLQYSWFLDNLSHGRRSVYSFFKRGMDIVIAAVLSVPSLLIAPFVVLAIKLDDGGDIYFTQKRLGKDNKEIRIWKFRTMKKVESGKAAADQESTNEVTRVGEFLRKSRIDELPQLYNVLRGDLSLIGPRPEIPELAREYEEAVPYYNVRHLIKPGISGWAQIYQEREEIPKFAAQAKETRRKLAYDLYYLKNRSFLLDLKIALRTLQILFSRSGR